MHNETNIEVLTFPIASGDMYYEVEEAMTVFVRGDVQRGFRLCGELQDLEGAPVVDFADILLEFALAWDIPGKSEEFSLQAQKFGKRIAEKLNEKLEESVLGLSDLDSLARVNIVLDCIFRSMNASYTVEREGDQLCIEFKKCSIIKAANAEGLMLEEEHAHQVLKAVGENVAWEIDPNLQVEIHWKGEIDHSVRVFSTT